MAEFLTGEKLANEVYDIIFNASKRLLIVSPYIRLDDYFKNKVFTKHKTNSSLHIIVVFGKNEKNPTKSFRKEDFDYFRDFPNISVVYVPNLHAKYYANEKKGMVTSINLYDFSFKNNIEYGVLSQTKLIGGTGIDRSAWDKTMSIIGGNNAIYIRRPKFKKKLWGLSKDYIGSDVELDLMDELLNGKLSKKVNVFDYMDDKFVDEVVDETLVSREEYEETIKEQKIQKFGGKLVSATVLGKEKNKSYKQVFRCMKEEGYVSNQGITTKGQQAGLNYKSNEGGDKWIVYPEAMRDLL